MKIDLDLDLDPTWLCTSMQVWCGTVDMKIPVRDSLKVYFLAQTAISWPTVLSACKTDGPDAVKFEVLKTEFTAFNNWAECGLQQMDAMAIQEAALDSAEQMLTEPGNMLRKHFYPKADDQDKPAS